MQVSFEQELSARVAEDEPPKGIEILQQSYDEANPVTTALNGAMALDISLRHTRNAIATGRDVSILGAPSQELLTDIILDMPIGIRQSHPFNELLFNKLVEISGISPSIMELDLIEFTRIIQSATSPYSTLDFQQRSESSMNITSYVRALSFCAQRLVDSELDTRRLGHEGAFIGDLHPDIYREFIDRDYLMFLMSKQRHTELSGLTGQVALRLLKEAEWLSETEQQKLGALQ